jgi:Uma2 family endonuclease
MPTVSVQLQKQPLKSWSQAQTTVAKTVLKTKLDRPGWIPSHIKSDWDTYPYAYQTEEEMMPQGGPHGLLSAYICELLRSYLKEPDFMLLQDPFLLYRDTQNIKQRIAPDLLLMPFRFPAPPSYDMDIEPPPPCVVEITSPDSHQKDLDDNKTLYMGLGISTYLVIDAITPPGKLRDQMELRVWQLINGNAVEMMPDWEGCLVLPEMGLKVGASGQELFFIDRVTGNKLLNSTELKQALQSEVQRAELEAQRAEIEARRALAASLRAAEEANELKRALQSEVQRAEIETQRAEIEAQRAEIATKRATVAEQRAASEAKARHAAEAEIARLKALLG